jgi:surfeit locus 1 family protein
MTADTAHPVRARLGFGFWSFIVFMLALTALFIWLGVWQIDRLAWKEGLIAQVSSRLTQPPTPLPQSSQWASLNPDDYNFRPVSLTGHYLADKTVPVFISLTDAKGKFSGPGYWIVVPFAPDSGGTAFINQGFVPDPQLKNYAAGQGVPTGEVTISGVAVTAEDVGMFTPAPNTKDHIEWVQNPQRLAAMAGVTGPLLGFTIDAPAGRPGQLPQGGETEIDFPNNHLGYAWTWFGFAIITPILLIAWIWRQVRPVPPKREA